MTPSATCPVGRSDLEPRPALSSARISALNRRMNSCHEKPFPCLKAQRSCSLGASSPGSSTAARAGPATCRCRASRTSCRAADARPAAAGQSAAGGAPRLRRRLLSSKSMVREPLEHPSRRPGDAVQPTLNPRRRLKPRSRLRRDSDQLVVWQEVPEAVGWECKIQILASVFLADHRTGLQLHLQRRGAVLVVRQEIRPLPIVVQLDAVESVVCEPRRQFLGSCRSLAASS